VQYIRGRRFLDFFNFQFPGPEFGLEKEDQSRIGVFLYLYELLEPKKKTKSL
jgi:hypothetical protein